MLRVLNIILGILLHISIGIRAKFTLVCDSHHFVCSLNPCFHQFFLVSFPPIFVVFVLVYTIMECGQSLATTPLFDGSNYDFWKKHMHAFLYYIDDSIWTSI